MKFSFRKIASVIASAVMIGSTLGTALAATNYPQPFVVGGAAQGAIVITSGTHAGASVDWDAAVGLKDALQGLVTTSTTSGASATGGDSINLASSSQKLFWNSSLNAAKTSLTNSELPTLLKSGTITDDNGVAYTYTQSITLGNTSIMYDTSGGDFTDPELYVNLGIASGTTPVYKYKFNLNKNLNVTSSTVQGNDIELLGQKYTIGSASTTATAGSEVIELFGSGSSVTLNEGQESKVTVAGTEHTVKLVMVDSASKAYITVDGGTTRDISALGSATVGGISVFVKTVAYSAKESSTNYATLIVGGNKIKLLQQQTATKGTDDISVQNTAVTITVDANKLLSSFIVNITAQDATKDWIKVGNSYVDPIFGNLKVNFASITPTLDDTSRSKLVVDTDNSRNARVTFTSALAGVEKQFAFLHDDDTSDSTITPVLADTANKTIHVVEGENISINEYMVINAGDYGRIVKLTSVPTGAMSSTSTIQFQDVVSGENLFTGSGLTVGGAINLEGNSGANASTNVDGQTYYFRVYNGSSSNVSVTWGTGAGYGTAGQVNTLFPRIKLQNGGWMAIMTTTTVTNGTFYSLPGVETLSTYETGKNASFAGNLTKYGFAADAAINATGLQTVFYGWAFGNANYTLSYNASGPATATILGIDTTNIGGGNVTVSNSSAFCSFNSTYKGAILFEEKKKTTESGNADDGDIICVYVDKSGSTTPVTVSAGQPYATTQWSGVQTWSSDSYQQSALTRFGTFIKYNTKDSDKVEIYYPNDEMFADVLFTAEGTTITPGRVAGGTILVVKDTEVDSVKDKNLVVVGGSCINSVAAKILGSDTPLCGADFTAKTKVDGTTTAQYIVKAVASPYNAAKTAVLVAGWEAANTKDAVAYLKTQKPATDVGTELVLPTATA